MQIRKSPPPGSVNKEPSIHIAINDLLITSPSPGFRGVRASQAALLNWLYDQ
jgi:hypothetical protein